MLVVDTCILIDIADDDPAFTRDTAECLVSHLEEGLLLSPVSYVELAPVFDGSTQLLDEFLAGVGVDASEIVTALDRVTAFRAWSRHITEKRSGHTRRRPVADALIGALAARHDGIITRNATDFRTILSCDSRGRSDVADVTTPAGFSAPSFQAPLLDPTALSGMLTAAPPQLMSAFTDPPAPRTTPVRLPLLGTGVSGRSALAGEVRPVDPVRPIYAVWEITRRCDLACHHCGTRAGHARSDELDTEECLDLVAQMAALGIKEVTLIGGEAYLRPDWLTIVAAVVAHGMDCSMTTGGRGITRERAEQAVAAGLQSAAVSLDGMEAAHDRQRALDGSFRAGLRAIGYLREAGLPVSVNTQVNAWSWRELPDLLEVLIAQQAHAWQLQLTVPMGRAADRPEILLQPYQLLEVLPLIASLQPRAETAGVRIFPGNNVGYFGPHEPLLRRYMPEQHRGSCGAGKVVLGLEANGTVKGCPSLPTAEWAGGSVREHSLQELWERSTPLRYTRDRTLDDLWGYCRECYYAAECMAGCTWMAHGLFGKPGNNPYCHHRALEMQRAGFRERVVLRERAPGNPFDHGVFELLREPFVSDEPEASAPST